MPNPSQEPTVPTKAPYQDSKDIDVLCSFKVKIEVQESEYVGIKDCSDHIKINFKMPNPSQKPPALSKAPNQDIEDMDVLCTFKIKLESQKSDQGFIKDHLSYPNQVQDATSQSGTCSILKSPKWGLYGHGCSFHLQNQDREPKS